MKYRSQRLSLLSNFNEKKVSYRFNFAQRIKLLHKKNVSGYYPLIIVAAIWVSVLATACAGSRPAVNWTFWRDLKVSIHTVDHPALAASYRQSAQEYRQIAQEHERMKAEYAEYDNDAAVVMQAHCDRLIEKHRSLAQEMEAMAKVHEKLAAKKRTHYSPRPATEPSDGQSHGFKVLEF